MWSSTREHVFEVKGDKCEECGKSREESRVEHGCDLHVDHIRAWHEFDSEVAANDIANLRPLCVSCHGKIGSKCKHGMYSEKEGNFKSQEYMLRVYGKKCNLTIDKARFIIDNYKSDGVSTSNIAYIQKETGVSRDIIRWIAKGSHWINAYI